MLAYSMILFAAAALLVKMVVPELVSKGLFVLTGSLIFSGIIALLGETPSVVIVSVSVSLAGIVISLLAVAKVQKEFNGGFIR